MGKIFNALEKYKKERDTGGQSGRITKADWDVLLQYDRQSGKLDVKDPAIVKSRETVKRLVTYRLIQADGTLTPAGRAKCAELERQRQGLDAISNMAAEAEAVFEDEVHSLSRDELTNALEGPEDRPEAEASKPDADFDEPEFIEAPAALKPPPADVPRQAAPEPVEPVVSPEADVPPESDVPTETETTVAEATPIVDETKAEEIADAPVIEQPAVPAAREDLRPEDWETLMQYEQTTGKLDVNNPAIVKDPAIVRRLLDHQMIVYGGELSDAAIEKCEQLERAKQKTIVGTKAVLKKSNKKKKASKKAAKPESVIKKKTVYKKPAKKEIKATAASPIREFNTTDPNLISLHRPQSFEAEQFKILRTNLLYPVSGNPPRSIMVTSAEPDEGKSFVASNLAISVARGINRYVLLMDCDLRRPSIHSKFGFGNVPGLSDYLSNGTPLENLLLKTRVDNLTILPGGQPPDNPSELLSSERMEALIEEVTERYPDRLIILDSPPPKLTAESGVLARRVDGVLVVVKFGKTKRDMVQDMVDQMGRDKVVGSIINNFDMRSSRYYAKHYSKYKV